MQGPKVWVGTAVIGTLLGGCGGGGNPAIPSVPATRMSAKPAKGLSAPVQLRCSVPGFGAPRAIQVGSGQRELWQLIYQRALRRGKARNPTETTRMVIVEEGPGVTLVQKIAGAEKRVVFGRHFEFKKLPAQFSASTARWRTGQALYTALGDGELLGFERFVACFP